MTETAFLKVAVGANNIKPVPISDADWHRLFVFCKQQALIGIGFRAVEKLHEQGIECPANLKMKWMALTLMIERRNAQINEQCKRLTAVLERDGLRSCILKGQGNLPNYPAELRMRRNPGDIDVWCVAPEGGEKAVREYVRNSYELSADSDKLFRPTPKFCYHHIEAPSIEGTEVEVHYKPSFCHSPLRNIRMLRWFKEHAEECMVNRTQAGFSVPTVSVNVVYQMCHLFSHYVETGLGLRQLMDYYFTLKVWQDSQSLVVSDKLSVMQVLRSFGMGKFAAAVMWVLHEVFAMPARYYICEPNEKEGRKVLAEIMQGGNFGQYDERGKNMRNGGTLKHGLWKLKRVMRLVGSYPEEALSEPLFRVWHLVWRIWHSRK